MSVARRICALALGACLLAATPAAAANPYTPKEVCGSNYVKVGGPREIRGGGRLLAEAYLMYYNGFNCVATIKRAYVGTQTYTEAWLWRGNYGNLAESQGNAAYYRTVTRYADDTCVAFGGYSSGPGNTPRGSTTSGFGWCD